MVKKLAGAATLAVALQLALVPAVASAQPGVTQQKLTASDAAFGDSFGDSVAMSGNTAVVGALLASPNGQFAQGAAYVFTRNTSGTWVQQQKLLASDGAPTDRFGGSVAIDENTMLIGAWGAANQTGAVYVFIRSGSTWVQQAKLTAPDGQVGDTFGEFVAIDGNTAVVGAPLDDGTGTNFEQGSAYVFTRSGTSWGAPVKLVRPEGQQNDSFGESVAVAGDRLLVGAPFVTVNGQGLRGTVYEYRRTPTGWEAGQVLTASDGAGVDRFGFSVTMDTDTAVIGAIGAAVGGNQGVGAAYVFTHNGSAWQERTKLGASDGAEFDNFGVSVALSGDRVVIGADFATVNGNTLQGAAYTFTGSGSTWTQEAKLVAADGAESDDFGRDVAIDGGTVIAGAALADLDPDDPDPNQNQGAAYVFTLP
jgi:hypothetical protein